MKECVKCIWSGDSDFIVGKVYEKFASSGISGGDFNVFDEDGDERNLTHDGYTYGFEDYTPQP